ncbi:putative zinc-binding protein [Trypanosoma grayi]|uniref:putative zinc-binding protein n=1 Tax=Trypanosoma grayi TaxID=71804 RepID=UPI0004F41C1E|nr:putative zinc-binding protein [Trypanosoma grayi]KEG11856.1 putative zinc-binding protein [Trypanosoma grayi]
MLERWIGLGITIVLILGCSLVMLLHLHIPVLSASPSIVDVLLTTLFLLALTMTLLSLFAVAAVDPGTVPRWFGEARIEEFVREVLAEVVRQGGAKATDKASATGNDMDSGSGSGMGRASQGLARQQQVWLAENAQNANQALEAAQEMRMGHGRNDGVSNVPISVEVAEDADDDDDVLVVERQQQRQTLAGGLVRNRRRERQDDSKELWMPHRNVFLVAADALVALNRSPESFEQEVSFLLGGARRCRFCRLYKLMETHHCSRCRRCVYQMDHHCPWIGQCVGHDNHKYFLLFIAYLTVTAGVATLHVVVTARAGRVNLVAESLSPLFLFSLILAGSFALVLFAFFVQDIWNLGRGQSTLELLRREERGIRAQRRRGPYAMLLEDEDESGSGMRRCSSRNFRRVYGGGAVLPWWFLPVPPQHPSPREQEEAFWATHRALLLHQLRAIADAEQEGGGGEEEEEEGEA